jgi:hypothetical protein
VSSIVLQMNIRNPTNGPVRVMHTRLVRPKVATDLMMLRRTQLSLPATDNVVPAQQISPAFVHIIVRRALAARADGKLPVVIKLTDHRGLKYRVKAVLPPDQVATDPCSSGARPARSGRQ